MSTLPATPWERLVYRVRYFLLDTEHLGRDLLVLTALAGGLALGVIESLGMHFTNPSLKALLSYAVFIGVLLWKPNGLFNKRI